MKFDFKIKTAEELYKQLTERGLIIDKPEEKVIHFLSHHSYFQFMLYFKNYWDSDRNFLEGVTFSTIRDAYVFDQKFRLLLLYYINGPFFKTNFTNL